MSEAVEYPEPPPGIRVLKNGAGYSEKDKRIVHGPGTYSDAPHNITSENAAAMAQIGRDNTKKAIRDAIVEQAKASGLNISAAPEAIGHAAGQLFGEVLDVDAAPLRDRDKALWNVAKYAGLVTDPRQPNSQQQTNVQVNITSDVLQRILGDTGGDVIDV